MKDPYTWNPYSDQPDTFIPKKKRIRHHLKHSPSYLSLAAANIQKAAAVLPLYRKYRKTMYQNPHAIGDPFSVSVSPAGEKSEAAIRILKETGVSKTLVRVHSWERENLKEREALCRMLRRSGMDVMVALLQDREDVLYPEKWKSFAGQVFERFKNHASVFEIGHAWNRIKWGLWNYKEYLELARAVLEPAQKFEVRLAGPAVIDFEFHLYAPILKAIPFDVVTSLLYVDRVGAPENRQCGWNTSRKLALLKAIVDRCGRGDIPLWITEFNWPVKGTGKYSPVSEEYNVTEEEQASYLTRYYILCLASGFAERITYWQLAAPGYGLVDSRTKPWRKRPGFYAFKTMVSQLKGAEFREKIPHPQAEIFIFKKNSGRLAAVWTTEDYPVEISLPGRVEKITGRDGRELPLRGNTVKADGKPCYIVFS